ncbi:DUF6966 domain-containing protein [Blastopirellula marina]|uniref:DUF6966 domain-containing protein n=1 Tax=Blastopirellula marina TaxID=124 RepID=A0A2S8GMX7_9BACT|nr:hypothetical protein [Blastopirellula marina]PQO45775.1 hypothetical protein C5Y93_12675 [Blastopirellula marina]
MDDDRQRIVAEAESKLFEKLSQMLEVLGDGNWSEHFRKVREELTNAKTWAQKNAAAARIRLVYGGMGSFNDWHVDGNVDGMDFDDLRTELYELSWTYERPEVARALLRKEGLA